MVEYTQDVARAYRAEATVAFQDDGCPAVVNHEAPSALAADAVRAALGADAVTPDAVSMASDDMSLFLQARPGCYLFVGAAPEDGPPAPHHAPEFRMNEDALAVGLRAGLAVMRAALQPRRCPRDGDDRPMRTGGPGG